MESISTPCDDQRNTTMCKYYVNGSCTKENCLYSHNLNEPQDNKQQTICRYYQNGFCANEGHCKYLHISSGDSYTKQGNVQDNSQYISQSAQYSGDERRDSISMLKPQKLAGFQTLKSSATASKWVEQVSHNTKPIVINSLLDEIEPSWPSSLPSSMNMYSYEKNSKRNRLRSESSKEKTLKSEIFPIHPETDNWRNSRVRICNSKKTDTFLPFSDVDHTLGTSPPQRSSMWPSNDSLNTNFDQGLSRSPPLEQINYLAKDITENYGSPKKGSVSHQQLDTRQINSNLWDEISKDSTNPYYSSREKESFDQYAISNLQTNAPKSSTLANSRNYTQGKSLWRNSDLTQNIPKYSDEIVSAFYQNEGSSQTYDNILDADGNEIQFYDLEALTEEQKQEWNKLWEQRRSGDPSQFKGRKPPLCIPGKSGHCLNVECPYRHGDPCEFCGCEALDPEDPVGCEEHKNFCIQLIEQDMNYSFQLQSSHGKICGICLDEIFENNKRFGLLPGCSHTYCLKCIRDWRERREGYDKEVVRGCPQCRQSSDFVVPSKYWVDDFFEKTRIIEEYKSEMKKIECKYFKRGFGKCPFGDKCHYNHIDKNGNDITGIQPRYERHTLFASATITVNNQANKRNRRSRRNNAASSVRRLSENSSNEDNPFNSSINDATAFDAVATLDSHI